MKLGSRQRAERIIGARSSQELFRRSNIVLQMFTHLSRTPFASEQNRPKDAKIKIACHSRSLGHLCTPMQRSEGYPCLTDKPSSNKLSLCPLRKFHSRIQ